MDVNKKEKKKKLFACLHYVKINLRKSFFFLLRLFSIQILPIHIFLGHIIGILDWNLGFKIF